MSYYCSNVGCECIRSESSCNLGSCIWNGGSTCFLPTRMTCGDIKTSSICNSITSRVQTLSCSWCESSGECISNSDYSTSCVQCSGISLQVSELITTFIQQLYSQNANPNQNIACIAPTKICAKTKEQNALNVITRQQAHALLFLTANFASSLECARILLKHAHLAILIATCLCARNAQTLFVWVWFHLFCSLSVSIRKKFNLH